MVDVNNGEENGITNIPSNSGLVMRRIFSDLTALCRFFFLIYYLFSILYRTCFLEKFAWFHSKNSSAIVAIFFDYAVDLFFLWDFSIKLRNKNVNLSVAPSAMNDAFLNLLKSAGSSDGHIYRKLFIDGLSLLPLEIFAYAAKYPRYSLLRVMRLLRLLNFFDYWSGVVSVLLRFEFFRNLGVQRVCYFFVLFAIAAHCGACLFYAIGISGVHQRISDGDYGASYELPSPIVTWVEKDGLVTVDSNNTLFYIRPLDYRYMRSLYWSIQTLASF